MWRLAFIGCCLLFCIIGPGGSERVPVPGRGALEGYCRTDNDCLSYEKLCCASFDTELGTSAEAKLQKGLRRYVDGYCETRGKSGSECLSP